MPLVVDQLQLWTIGFKWAVIPPISIATRSRTVMQPGPSAALG